MLQLLAAVVDDAGDLGFEVAAGDDAVDEAVFEEELGGLEAFGEFETDGGFDGAGAGEADEGLGFGDADVAERGEAGGDAAHGGIGEDGDEQAAGLVVAAQGGGDFGHLHQGKDAFVHAGTAAGGTDDDEGELLLGRSFGKASQLFADHRTHAAHDERRIGDADGHTAGADHAGAGEGGVAHVGALLFGFQAVGIGAFIGEAQGIDGFEGGVPFFERAVVEQLANAFLGGDVEMVITFGADVLLFFRLLAKNDGIATGTSNPETFGDAAFGSFAVGS